MTASRAAMLFVPGGDDRKLGKIAQLAVDSVILDLEDAVAASAKEQARRRVAAAIADAAPRPEIFVRVNNAAPIDLHDDLVAVVGSGLTGVVLPKTETAADVERVDWLIGILEERHRLAAGSILIMPTIESVRGLSNCAAIASASRRVLCLAFGAGDFSLDVGIDWPSIDATTNPLVIQAKQEMVLLSRNAGLPGPHDGAYPTFRDRDGLRAEATYAASIGMSGKHAIHPDQVPVIEAAFAPSPASVRRAQRVVDQFGAAERTGIANIDVDGLFVDYPVAHRAAALLAQEEARLRRAQVKESSE